MRNIPIPEHISKIIEKNSQIIIKLGECKGCMREVLSESFDSEISKREYEISGLCQRCQKGIQP